MCNHLIKQSIVTPFVLALVACLSASESSAQETTKEIPNWGRFEDPSGQAKVEVTDSGLTITSGKNEMRATDPLGRTPRIIREVEGNFDVQVQVQGELSEEYQTGVLIAYKNDKEYFAVRSGSGRYQVKEVGTTVMTRGQINGGAYHRRKSASNWIRLQRIGNELTSYYSDDGQTWMQSRRSSDIKFSDGTVSSYPGPMKVMLLVHNRARKPLSVSFENFKFCEGGEVEAVVVAEDPEQRQMEQRLRESAARFEKIRPKLIQAFERANAITSISRPAAVEALRDMGAKVAIQNEGGLFSFGIPTGISWVTFDKSSFSERELDEIIFALSRLGVQDIRIELRPDALNEAQRQRLMHEVPGKTGLKSHQYFDARQETPQNLADRKQAEPDTVLELLNTGLMLNELPANLVIRVESDLWKSGAKSKLRRKETWEFSAGKVHKIVSDLPQLQSPDSFRPRVAESQPLNTSNLCQELLDGGLLKISEEKGNGKPTLFAGTEYDIGYRAIMLLVDGKPVLDVRESCFFAGFAETDALAFAKLYEQLAAQARAAFQDEKSESKPRPEDPGRQSVHKNLKSLGKNIDETRGFIEWLVSSSTTSPAREGVTPLMRAARANDIQALKKHIEESADVNETSKYGWTALMFAAWKGHEQAVKLLLDAGADPNVVSKRIARNTQAPTPKTTALAEAIKNDHISIANTLLDRGASADSISVAIAGGMDDVALLKKMHAAGADLNQSSGVMYYPSAMVSACQHGRLQNVKWLIEQGVQPGLNALQSAVGHDHFELVKYLLAHEDAREQFSAQDKSAALLHAAIKNNTKEINYDKNLQIIELLLNLGADPNYRPDSGHYKTIVALQFLKERRVHAVKRIKANRYGDSQQTWERKRLQHRDAIIKLLENMKNEQLPNREN